MSATKPPTGYDDRFVVPLEPSRRGAHRARVSPVVGALPVLAVVAVVVVVVVMAWTLFGPTSDGTSINTVAPGPAVTGNVAPSGPTGQPTRPAPSDTVSTPATATEGAVNKTVGVTVLNSTKRNGLARKVSNTLTGKGWVATRFATTSTAARTTTTAFYATTAQKAAAEAIVADLGVGTIKKSTAFGTAGITVVVGSDYP